MLSSAAAGGTLSRTVPCCVELEEASFGTRVHLHCAVQTSHRALLSAASRLFHTTGAANASSRPRNNCTSCQHALLHVVSGQVCTIELLQVRLLGSYEV